MNVTAINKAQLRQLDNSKINKTHWCMVFTAGMGFFTDAYDLFVIGVVTALLVPLWHLSAMQLAVLNGASLLAAATGAIVFGRLADKFGRKKLYGIEVLILFFGALMSAIAPSFIWLLISRVIVGFGIGGDYPTSAIVVSESANVKNRGFLVLLVFAMQAVGLIFGPLFASLLLFWQLSPHYVWRILLAFGAIPAASVFYLRRTIAETPRFLMDKQAPIEVSHVVSDLIGHEMPLTEKNKSTQSLWNKKHVKYLLGTAGAWFLLDVAFYGNGVSSLLIINQLFPHATLVEHTLSSAILFLCFAVPGYYFSAKYVDKIGRKRLQYLGFTLMAICYGLIAFLPNITHHFILFTLVFGLSFFFINFGPNTTTFLIPSEIFPTKIRASAHGLSAAIGKMGAFLGAFFLPLVLSAMGMSFTIAIMAGVSLIGVLVTTLVPEMTGVSLDMTEREH